MATGRVYLSGGPCDGKTKPSTDIKGSLVAYVACGGGYYTVSPTGKRHKGDLIFNYAGTTNPDAPTGPGVNAPQALKGWKAIRKGWNTTLPHSISYMQRNNKAALRSLSRARKVRL